MNTKNNYRYTRLYDFCIPDDFKTGGRYFSRRRNRIKTTLSIAFLHIVFIVLSYPLIDSESRIYLIVILVFSLYLNLTFGRLDPFSLLYLFYIKKIDKKGNRNCFENLILQTNLDNKFLARSHENFIQVRSHFNWLHVSLVYRDKIDGNLYFFKVYLDKIVFKIKTSKKFRKDYPKNVSSAFMVRQVFNLNDFNGCESSVDLHKRITEIYIQKRNELYSSGL